MNEVIKDKSGYCLSCKHKPCSRGCPLGNDIPKFIKEIKEEKFKEAYSTLLETTVLSSICGRICPNTYQCAGNCIRKLKGKPVDTHELEAFIGDKALEEEYEIPAPKTTKYNVAVIGSGPASLTCAAFLRRNGIGVTIIEKHNYLGGLLVHGIPDFRLDKKLVKKTIDRIINLGIKVKLNTELGKAIKIAELEREYDAIFLGIGANIPKKMNIEGEDLKGVYGGNKILETKPKINYKDKTIIVSGGGNVAIDVARFVKRKDAKKVIIVYRRSLEEMPANEKEINEALEEGIETLYQTNIIKINGKTKVKSVEVVKTDLIKKDGEKRLTPVNIEGSNYTIECDYVMMAVGSKADESITSDLGLDLYPNGKIIINHKYQTSNKKIFAGGDVTNTEATVAWAARSGRDAAQAIIEYLKEQ